MNACSRGGENLAIMRADLLVVGAGPTGLTLANLLGTMGVNTIIVERNLTTVREPRAVSIDDESMRTMQAVGLADAVGAIVARGYGSRYLSPSGKQFALSDPVSREYGFDKRNAFQQPELEEVLRNGLSRFACVTALFQTEMTSFEQSQDGVRAALRRADGSEAKLLAQYLVGCDGGRSGVRKSLGIALVGSSFAERWLIVDLVRTCNRFRHTQVFCNPRRSCISLPGPNGIRRYEFILGPDEDDRTASEEGFVRRLLSDVGPDKDAPIRRTRVYTFHARLAERWRERRVFLAGDAAHLTPPFAGQGMNSGLRDAHNLAWKLAEAVNGGMPDTLLDSYESERRPHAWSMIELAMRMGRVMTPRSVVQGTFIRAGFRLLGLYPRAKEYFVQMRYKPTPRFKHGLFWPDQYDAKSTMVGRLVFQPEVEDENRSRALLDDCLPDKPVVLVFSEEPDRILDTKAHEALQRGGAAVIGITPEWMNSLSGEFPVFRDASRLFSAPQMKRYLDHALLLRRDRYVAATRPVARASELATYLRELTRAGSGASVRCDGE